MFDVYSTTQDTRGQLVGQLVGRVGDALIYANKQIVGEGEKLISLPSGQSYELIVSEDYPLSIDFETVPGAGDGVTTELVLTMLYHRQTAQFEQNPSEAASLALRAIKMAIDALNDKGS